MHNNVETQKERSQLNSTKKTYTFTLGGGGLRTIDLKRARPKSNSNIFGGSLSLDAQLSRSTKGKKYRSRLCSWGLGGGGGAVI